METNKRRILEMLADKKINVDEASRLLGLIEEPASDESGASGISQRRREPKYLRVVVQPNVEGGEKSDYEHVNVRVPMTLIRAGIKLTSLIPASATEQVNQTLRSKGINMDIRDIKAEDLEQLVDALSDLEVDVGSGKEKVRVYVE